MWTLYCLLLAKLHARCCSCGAARMIIRLAYFRFLLLPQKNNNKVLTNSRPSFLHIFCSKCVEEAVDLHSTMYTQTLEAGRHLCKSMTESECQSRLQSELQGIEETWTCTTSLLAERKALINTTIKVTKSQNCNILIHYLHHIFRFYSEPHFFNFLSFLKRPVSDRD